MFTTVRLNLMALPTSKLAIALRYWIPIIIVIAPLPFVAWELQGIRFQFGSDVTNWIAGYMVLSMIWSHMVTRVLGQKKSAKK